MRKDLKMKLRKGSRIMKKKKTMHELCKEFPNKTYAELEKYRNADRFEEAQRVYTQDENEELREEIGIGHNNPPEDDEEKHEV